MKGILVKTIAMGCVLALLLPSGIGALAKPLKAYEDTKKIVAAKANLLIKEMGTVSVQYALIDNGKIVISGQTGKNDPEHTIPLTKDTMYSSGSISKVFTAAAVMRLVDDGKLKLDTPVVQYIPDFKMKDERYNRITPRMLLNHSSGLRGTTAGNITLLDDNDTIGHDTLLKELSKQTLKADPGAYSVYCNDGFTLAEILVEKVSGQSFTSFIHSYITKPLSLNHTKTTQDSPNSNQVAGTYHPAFEGQLPMESGNDIGAGGIYSTAEDLVRFAQISMGTKKGIISEASIRAMQSEEYKRGLWPEDADNSMNYGLGWDSVRLYPFNEYGIQALYKGGDTFSYHAALVVLPEQKMAAAVLSSSGSGGLNVGLANELLLQALKEKGQIHSLKPEKTFGKPIKANMPDELKQYAGYYGATDQVFQASFPESGELKLTRVGNPEAPAEQYIYTSNGTFLNEMGTRQLRFITEKNGRSYIRSNSYITIPGIEQQLAQSEYRLQKMTPNPISPELESIWEKRAHKKYYPISEKYTSAMYTINVFAGLIGQQIKKLPGYLYDKEIRSADVASNQLQIPGVRGRDNAELYFYRKNGVEYVDAYGITLISDDGVSTLNMHSPSTITIPSDGSAQWYKIPSKEAGKKLTVKMPAQGSYGIYDETGDCTQYVLNTSKPAVELPKNGMVVFVAGAGSKFEVTVK